MQKQSKQLRFATCARVSTEQQKDRGESLRIQNAQMEEAVRSLKGKIVEPYSDKEQATPGHSKKMLERLLHDAQRKRFDAVMFSHADRFSRDNASSKRALQIFRDNAIRFFVLHVEYDLEDASARFYLGMSAEVGELVAATQSKKSIEARIARAQRNIPASGYLPFGRTFDKKTETWGLQEDKAKIIQEIAQRYINGEQLAALAQEYSIEHTTLHQVLMNRSGSKWTVVFKRPWLRDSVTVHLKIPALLDDKTIKQVHARRDQQKRFDRKHITNRYLFSRIIFCEHCGRALTGQTLKQNGKQWRYYRHLSLKRHPDCKVPKSHLNADTLEHRVMLQLFEDLGNPAAVRRAINDAIPNKDQIQKQTQRLERLRSQLKQAQTGIDRILKLIAQDTISEQDAERQLKQSKQRQEKLTEQIQSIEDDLARIPQSKNAEHFSTLWKLKIKTGRANRDFEAMTFEDKRDLLKSLFSEKKAGIYIKWSEDGKRFKFKLKGSFPLYASQAWSSASHSSYRFLIESDRDI